MPRIKAFNPVDTSRRIIKKGLRSPALAPSKRGHTSFFDPRVNRHTGKPHEHKREIARRQRQSA